MKIYTWANTPNWRTHIFQRGRSTTNQSYIIILSFVCPFGHCNCTAVMLKNLLRRCGGSQARARAPWIWRELWADRPAAGTLVPSFAAQDPGDWIPCCFYQQFPGMTSLTLQTSSRVWSCSTLRDGADHILEEAQKIEDEEDRLEKMIQEQRPASKACWNHPRCEARRDFGATRGRAGASPANKTRQRPGGRPSPSHRCGKRPDVHGGWIHGGMGAGPGSISPGTG